MAAKYFIKCNHCGELTEVHSQYMTFCPHCQAKMDNSFALWSAREAAAGRECSFADYLSQVCVSGAAIEGVREQRRIGRLMGRGRSARRWVLSLVVAIVVVALGVLGYIAISRYMSARSIKAIMEQTWRINYYKDMGVTLKFPYNLTLTPVIESDSAASDSVQVVLSSVTRSWSEPKVLMVNAMRIDYEPDFGVNRDVATRQILMSMLQNNELQAFEFFQNDYSMPGLEARMLSGSYLIGIDPFEFRALMVQRESTVWYFMVAYPRADPEGLLVADRLFKGILIE